jgi:endonuclease-3
MQALRAAYPDAHCALRYESPFQLLIATILSAQCTDERVNVVTASLFAAYPDAASMAGAPLESLEELVRPTGFFRQKARNIQLTAQRIMTVYDGEMPTTIAELTTLPGAARKTANVVISNCFPESAEGIAVDTHVQRITRRMGLVRSWDPVQLERDLMRTVDRAWWNELTHLVIDHGRAVCKAPTPRCEACPAQIAQRCASRERWIGLDR